MDRGLVCPSFQADTTAAMSNTRQLLIIKHPILALKYLHAWLQILPNCCYQLQVYRIWRSWLTPATKHPVKSNPLLKRNMTLSLTGSTVSCVVRAVRIENLLGGLSRLEHAQPCQRGQGLEGSGGSERWPSGPWGGWFPLWLSLFPANNWDLIWEEISKAPVTPLLRPDRFPSLALKETSPSHDALWRPWVVEAWQWAVS